MNLRRAAAAVVIFVCGALYRNWDGDESTLRNCVKSGVAEMVGGEKIQCSLIEK